MYEEQSKEIVITSGEASRELRISKVILPSVLGLGVVAWLMLQEFDVAVFQSMQPGLHTVGWLVMAAGMYALRHMFFAWRLRMVTDRFFTWMASVRLVVLWEFSTAVSPTSVGGAGVALYLLTREGLSGARTIATVLYNMISDTLLFMISLPLMYVIVGPGMIRPGLSSLNDVDGYGMVFLGMVAFIYLYGILFFAGLFVWPSAIAGLLRRLSLVRWLHRWSDVIRNTSEEMVLTAAAVRNKPVLWHLRVFLATLGAWLCRFAAFPFLFLAFVSSFHPGFQDILTILARGEAMHVITSATPTPGAAGVAEYVFGGFFSDYVPLGVAAVIALTWRLLGYYSYLVAGCILIPSWWKSTFSEKPVKID